LSMYIFEIAKIHAIYVNCFGVFKALLGWTIIGYSLDIWMCIIKIKIWTFLQYNFII
jgi:hypothetical protein